MHNVIISLASNRYQKSNLLKARQCLGEILFDEVYTEEMWTEPIGTSRSELYLNQLVKAATSLSAKELVLRLKDIETAFGRTPEKRQLGIVPVDLDVLMYDHQRFHERDWQRPYVQQLIDRLH